MLLLLGALLIFSALFLILSAVGGLSPERQGVNKSLDVLHAMTGGPSAAAEEMAKDEEKSFAERVLIPTLERLQGMGRRITGADQAERIRQQLDRAGNPAGWTIDRISAGKILGAVVGVGAGAYFTLLTGQGLPVIILGLAAGAALGFFAPNIWLYNTATKREEELLRELPDAIDLLTISVEAGLGFDAALQQVARKTEGPLAGELARVLQEMQIGRSRADALRALGERSHVKDLKTFTTAMVQADAVGVPIGQVLRVQSGEIRTKRRQRAEEKAGQVPVKIMIPVILFILPCLMIIVMGPGILSIIRNLSGT